MSCKWFNQLKEAATIAKAAFIVALISQIPQREHILPAELKRMVNSYQFESFIHLVEAVS